MHAAAVRRLAVGLLVGTVLACAGWALLHQFAAVSGAQLLQAARAQPAWRLASALGLTALSFAALAAYDLLAARVVAPGRVGAGTALLAGAVGNALSNTLGFHAVTGTAVRLHIYRSAGLGTADAARIVSLSWLALALGFLTMLGGALGVEAVSAGASPARAAEAALGACAIAAGVGAFALWLAGGERRLALGRFSQPLPSARVALAQMAIGALETAAALGALYLLLPADLAPDFSVFAVGCIAAILLGIAAHAPGGIGVFEASISALLGGAGRADLLAALLLYRLVYNALPFLLALAALAVFRGHGARRAALAAVNSTAGSA